jgi:hypothetical protein
MKNKETTFNLNLAIHEHRKMMIVNHIIEKIRFMKKHNLSELQTQSSYISIK